MRRLIILILALTVADAVCTAAGLSMGVISEANPILSGIFPASPVLSCAALCVFVAVLLRLLYFLQDRVKWLKNALTAVAAVKLVVLGMHFAWIARVIRCITIM